MKLRVWLRILMLCVALGGLTGVVVLSRRWLAGPNSQVLMLSGGARFELLGLCTNGAEFTTEQPWQRGLRRILPKPLSAKLPPAFTSRSGSGNPNTVALWFTLTDAVGANVTACPWQWYQAVGDDGFLYPLNGGGGSQTSGGKCYHRLDLTAFPRRQKDFELRLLDSERKQVASLRLPNPVAGPYPVWQPEALPITKTNGPLAVTIERLTEAGRDSSYWVNPTWKMVQAEPEWRQARPSYQVYEDATGNSGGRLAFTEPAWKLTLPFHRRGWNDFAANEKFFLAGLNVPAPGEMQLLRTNFSCAGVSITVQALAAAGTLSITNGTNYAMTSSLPGSGWGSTSDGRTTVESISSLKPFFLIQTSELQSGAELRFRVLSSDGIEISTRNDGWHGATGGGRRYQQTFEVTNGVETISLEVILSRPRVFEFFVNPAEVQRLVNPNK